jgi:PAS domain S-box-containing protein
MDIRQMSRSLINLVTNTAGPSFYPGQLVSTEVHQMNDQAKTNAELLEENSFLNQRIQELEQSESERKRMEEALRESEESYRNLFENAGEVIYVAQDGKLVFLNPMTTRMTGYTDEELLSMPFTGFIHPEDRDMVIDRHVRRMKGEELPPIYPFRILHRDGHVRWAELNTILINWQGKSATLNFMSDVTDRKRAENDLIVTLQQLRDTRDMLVQFEKHAAVGRLAAGVAHEILNPASIISSRLQFLEEENLSEPARENVRVSREQLQRIVKISHDLLQSSAKKPRVLVGGDLRRVIEVGLQMTELRRKEDHVRVEYNSLPETIPVKMEMDRVVQVMVNLILNACDAMTGNYSKRMIVTVYRPEVSSTRPSVRLIVADNGHGNPAGDLDKIFEPYFTTKAPGKGTGLGLSVSKGIIQEHGGTLHAKNNDMGGASFIVELPLDHT